MKAPHTRTSLHLVTIVAKPSSQPQPLPKGNHDSFTILETSKNTRSQENRLLVQASRRKVHLKDEIYSC